MFADTVSPLAVAAGMSGGAGAPGPGAGTADDGLPTPPALVPTDSVIGAVVGSLPTQVPVFPVLLPLLAALLLLLASAVLAAYRRTQEARRYARLERTKSDFMKLASHELRTPLTVLRGYVSLIRDGDIRPATAEFERAFPIIEDRLEQVNTIVEQMLEAARLEDGKAILNLETLDLAELAAGSVEGVRARSAGTHPIVYRRPAASMRLLCDRTRVAAILDQLLDNAVKYTPAGGEIHCSLAESAGRAVFIVRDSGLGIAAEDFDRLFTRFGRLVTRENSHIPGAGLGLYLAREHARRMGGDITVDSRPSEGSAFTLSLPLVVSPDPDGAREKQRARTVR
jgi:signal transduction histidine kinase